MSPRVYYIPRKTLILPVRLISGVDWEDIKRASGVKQGVLQWVHTDYLSKDVEGCERWWVRESELIHFSGDRGYLLIRIGNSREGFWVVPENVWDAQTGTVATNIKL